MLGHNESRNITFTIISFYRYWISISGISAADLPATSLGLLLEAALLPPEICKEATFSGRSGITVDPAGTKAARSGGWSFPTVGLAYNKYINIELKYLVAIIWRIRQQNYTPTNL